MDQNLRAAPRPVPEHALLQVQGGRRLVAAARRGVEQQAGASRHEVMYGNGCPAGGVTLAEQDVAARVEVAVHGLPGRARRPVPSRRQASVPSKHHITPQPCHDVRPAGGTAFLVSPVSTFCRCSIGRAMGPLDRVGLPPFSGSRYTPPSSGDHTTAPSAMARRSVPTRTLSLVIVAGTAAGRGRCCLSGKR